MIRPTYKRRLELQKIIRSSKEKRSTMDNKVEKEANMIGNGMKIQQMMKRSRKEEQQKTTRRKHTRRNTHVLTFSGSL